MLKIASTKQLSLHSLLYNKIPENHILKVINEFVDFRFINDLLENTYCKNFGRPAKEPELMCKLLFLQHFYNLSDERVIEEASLNLAYLYFLGLNPEDSLPDKSLLAKFRVHRLQEVSLDTILSKIVEQCVIHGIVDGKSVSIDATHIKANVQKLSPEKIMKELAKKVLKQCELETGAIPDTIEEMPNYREIEDHHKAKAVMKAHLDDVIEKVSAQKLDNAPKTEALIDEVKTITEDEKFLKQKGVRSITDTDARVGHKSKEKSFLGYKTELMMTTEENIITAVRTFNGAYVDGSCVDDMLTLTQKTGIQVTEVYGDKAYFRKPILDSIKTIHATPYIPVSEVVYKIDESQFNYNKDADEWTCQQGNTTEQKKSFKRKRNNKDYHYYKYYFNLKQCKACPMHEMCAKKSARKILSVGLNTPEFYEISQRQKDKAFLEKYKKRSSIESKNAEVKRFHGLYRARGYGLISVSKQAKLTAIVVNLKRIAALISKKKELLTI